MRDDAREGDWWADRDLNPGPPACKACEGQTAQSRHNGLPAPFSPPDVVLANSDTFDTCHTFDDSAIKVLSNG